MENKNKSFVYESSSFSAGTVVFKLIGDEYALDKGIFRDLESILPGREPEDFTATRKVSNSKLEIFWKEIDLINVRNWKKEYFDSDILDGHQWSLEVDFDDVKYECSGSNDYPPLFDELYRIMDDLMGFEYWTLEDDEETDDEYEDE